MSFESILGKAGDTAKTAMAELFADTAESDSYQPFLVRPSAQISFILVEANGTMHGFLYHTLRHPKFEVRGGEEIISFVSDGIAVVMQGVGMRVMFRALIRHALMEVHEYDGKPPGEIKTRITRLEVDDPKDAEQHRPQPRLVK